MLILWLIKAGFLDEQLIGKKPFLTREFIYTPKAEARTPSRILWRLI